MAARWNPKRGKAKTQSSRMGPGKGAGKKDGNGSQSFIGKVAQGILSRLIADGVKEVFGDILGSEDFDFWPEGEDGEGEDGEGEDG
jgi:hypothetical protein